MAQQYYHHERSRYKYVQEESCSEESSESGSEEEESEEEVEEVITHGHWLKPSAPQSSYYAHRQEDDSYGSTSKAPQAPLSFKPKFGNGEKNNYYACQYEQSLHGGKPKIDFDRERNHGSYDNYHEEYESTVENHSPYSYGSSFQNMGHQSYGNYHEEYKSKVNSHSPKNFGDKRGHGSYDVYHEEYKSTVNNHSSYNSEDKRGHGPYDVYHEEYKLTVNNQSPSSYADRFPKRSERANETSYYTNFKEKDKSYKAYNHYPLRPVS